ncbi:hypothetical protein ACFLT2_13280 [Acidobacteriota bacterium]
MSTEVSNTEPKDESKVMRAKVKSDLFGPAPESDSGLDTRY